ncbi:hypothetical protein amb2038 [Paramagnetospirillum magneticum AMB-1]|uniref:BREX protein BrxA n=2 Tax=Paramagnetospirillum magneticum TaxID=84159 RepID=BRXA_PARM1|nr:RecName: Full=BREX protein BrxA [Paramagnetospirillum magneticum AMB-1]BAE50842.1 hypothetical protein amb2038 [Paramagnetospirillum magneticum AMB-1]
MAEPRYKADIGGGSLKLPESRIIAGLLLEGVTEDQWRHAIEVENVLQRRSPGTAKRQSSLMRNRLETMGPELWQMVRDGSTQVAIQAVFAAAIKHSTLLGDFLDLVVRDQFRMFRPDLPRKMWDQYLEQCRNRDPLMPVWQDSTANKLADCVYRILVEVGYITDSKTYRLKSVRISGEVMSYLRENNEQYVIRCIQVSI